MTRIYLVSLFLVACGSESPVSATDPNTPGPLMRPGEQCLSCHRQGGQASRRPWTAAGTVFRTATSNEGVEGATIVIEDAAGKRVSLVTNAVGNFYTADVLAKPLRMKIRYDGREKEMPIPLDADGACNACHSHPDPIGEALGRIRIP